MSKLAKFALVTLMASNLLVFPNRAPAQAGQGAISIGVSNSEAQTEELLGWFGAGSEEILYIDGETVNKYLNDGTTNDVQIFSSSKVTMMDPGYGVNVFVLTPENITSVSESAYKNAAIAAGATNAEILIASVQQVSGEGALAGVYEIFSSMGKELDAESIKIAENLIQIEQLLSQESNLNATEISRLVTQFNYDIIGILEEGNQINQQTVSEKLDNILTLYNFSIPQKAYDLLVEHGIAFGNSDVARDPLTKQSLEIALETYAAGDFSHLRGNQFDLSGIEYKLGNIYLTDERNEFSDEKYDNILSVEYTLTNNSQMDYFPGGTVTLFVNSKPANEYFMLDSVVDSVPVGRTLDVKQYFGFNGAIEDLELEFRKFDEFPNPTVIVSLTDPNASISSTSGQVLSDVPEGTDQAYIDSIEDEDMKKIMLAFVDAGLNIYEPEDLSREKLGMAPYVTDNAIRFGAQVASEPFVLDDGSVEKYNFGRLFKADNEEDAKLLLDYYVDLGRQSAAWYSHTYHHKNIVFQMGGAVPDEAFEKYVEVLDQVLK